MAAFADNVRFIPTAGGTADFVFSSPVGGCQSPTAGNVQNGVKYKLRAESADLTQWEIFEGAYNSSTGTFARTTVLYNSAGTGSAAPGQSGAGAKINFSAVPQVAIVGLAEDLISVEVANSFTAVQKAQARTNIAAVLKGHIFGLTLSTAGSSSTFSVAAGEAADSTAADLMALAASLSKTTGAWAVGSGNGGLDTGAIANSTWYHVHLIKRPDTGVVDALISLSATAPTLPANYTIFRRVGSIKTNTSGQWFAFTQFGDEFLWSTPVNDVNTTALGTAATLFTLSVPTGFQVNALFRGFCSNASATVQYLINSPDEASASVGAVAGNITSQNPLASGSSGAGFTLNVRTNTSGQIRAVAQNASSTLVIATHGWIDRRGMVS